jgi:enamine deaminase RidA (YjgF/YER057c/UK114 family)
MTMETRTIKGSGVVEIYITATPVSSLKAQAQSEELFYGAAKTLRESGARTLQERIFGTAEALKAASSIRAKIYGELDDGVAPTWLVTSEGVNGPMAGIQIHAVAGCDKLDVLKSGDIPCGRIARIPGLAYLTLSSVRQPKISGRTNQARAMLETAESVLSSAGVNFLTVPRTWMWLENILAWYGDFNLVRNTFFKERGVITKKGSHRMPASTGIGIRTENGALCAMELAAVAGDTSAIEYLAAGGNQESAFEYGSAFSRACRAKTLAGDTVYISGTASIGADGKTLHLGDARAQIQATIDNISALLKECNCNDADVVQAIAYSKTPEIDKIFADGWKALRWPIVPVIADICRDDLLFEIEVTAAKKR